MFYLLTELFIRGVFDDNVGMIFWFLIEDPYGVTTHLNRLVEMVQMRGHNMFLCTIYKNYP